MENNKKEELINLCQYIIKIQSYSGNEGKLVEFLEKKMKECGFDDVIVDKYGSIIGKIKGIRPWIKVLFDEHIDTVPAEDAEKWSHDPFGAVIEDGRIYGRGIWYEGVTFCHDNCSKILCKR